MRSYEELKWILELWTEGHTKQGISFLTGIPRGTVRDCILRYGSVENLDLVMSRNELLPSDATQRVEQ